MFTLDYMNLLSYKLTSPADWIQMHGAPIDSMDSYQRSVELSAVL